ncbi:MAG TPA: choice-of-anchor D domain-containing protein [Terriglobales bacterium]
MRWLKRFCGLLGWALATALSVGVAQALVGDGSDSELLAAKSRHSVSQRVVDSEYAKLPLAFERNRGQSDSQVLYLARGIGYTLFLTSDQAVLALKSRQFSVVTRQLQGATDNRQQTTDVLRMKLAGADPHASVAGMDEISGRANYFIGNDPSRWKTDIPNYARVAYQDVYPGIRLVYHGMQQQLEEDWVVAPGADPGRIALAVEGAKRVSIDASGDLRITVAGGELRLRKPVIYQSEGPNRGGDRPRPVPGGFVLKGRNRIGFRIGAYDRSKELVIDPVLVYSTFLGGTQFDEGRAITIDSAGEAYIAGDTVSTDFPTTSGVVQGACKTNSLGECSNAFVTKLSADGTSAVFSTYLGGTGSDLALGVALDSSGNAYLTGETSSSDFPTQNPYQATLGCSIANCTNAFVSEISNLGSSLVYSTYLGGDNVDEGNGIAVGSAGHAYVVGETSSGNFPILKAFQSKFGGQTDAFVAEIDTGASGSASLVYSTYLGGSAIEYGNGIALDSAANAYVTGSTQSTDFPATAGAFQVACKLDASKVCEAQPFVAKLNASGSGLTYGTYLGGSGGGTGSSGTDSGKSIAVDSSGNAYIAGETASADFPVTAGAFQTKCGTDGQCNPASGVAAPDAFVSKLNSTASALVYSTYLGGSGVDFATGIALGPNNVVNVTGGTDSTDFPTANPVQPFGAASAGGRDAFVTAFDSSGSGLIFSTYLGGSADDVGYGLTVDSAGQAYVAGSTASTNFPTLNPFQSSNKGNTDAFVTLIGSTTAPFVLASPSPFSLGNVAVGSTSSPQALTLSNTGDASLSISSLKFSGTNPGDFSETDNCVGAPVASGSTCTVNVTFMPGAEGARTATLTIADNAFSATQTVTLTGTGIVGLASLSTTSLSFGNQPVGVASGKQPVTLTNTGTGSLGITSVAIGGANSGDFAQTNTCGASLAAGGTCTINVTFTPAAIGARAGTLTITDNNNGAANSTQTVSLSGSGTGAVVSLAPSAVVFGAEDVGTTSMASSVTLTNNGNATLTISATAGPSITGAQAGDFKIQSSGTTCTAGATVAPGKNCAIAVTFTPSAHGLRSGSLNVTDNALGGNTQAVPLSGTGKDYSVSAAPASDSVSPGTSANYTVTLTPLGGFDESVQVACAEPAALTESTCTASPASTTLNGSSAATVAITVTTTAPSLVPLARRIAPPAGRSDKPLTTPAVWLAVLGLLGVLSLAKRRRPWTLLAVAVLFVIVWASCGGGGGSTGGGSSNPGTPAGTYSLTLSATGGNQTHTAMVSLTVQ